MDTKEEGMSLRFSKKGRTMVVFAVTVALTAIGTSWVVAGHQFSDVPNSSPYHSAIDYIADHGITAGCAADRYCPNSALTRAQMAVFLEKTAKLAPVRDSIAFEQSGADRSIISTTPTWTDIPGTTVTINVPSPNSAWLVVRFSAETFCRESAWCSVRILVDDAELSPGEGSNFAFDEPGSVTPPSFSNHSMERFGNVGPGVHTIKAQATLVGAEGPGATFNVDDSVIVVERFII